MTPEEFAIRAQEIVDITAGDAEVRHSMHDELCFDLLAELGYADGVRVIHEQERWYA